ncbi:MAG: prenyltransferase [Sedimenticolaceae bacterium]|nr:prenyltransferase [Sedimenticolaceae bacterium]
MTRQGMAVLLASARLPFLLLPLVLVLLGVASAFTVKHAIDWEKLAIILLTAVSAHVSVNTLNEYFDFRVGLDAVTEKTPFSGGSGALPENPQQAQSVFLLGIASLLMTLAAGLYLVSVTGWELLLPGVAGVLIVALYTPWMTRSPFLSLVMPGAGFGMIMVIGTAYVLAGEVTLTMVLASLVPFFLVNNLLLLNQFPDIRADREHGRRNLPILYGTKVSGIVYLLFNLSAAAVILAGILLGVMPLNTLLPVLLLVAASPIALMAAKRANDMKRVIPLMTMNLVVTLVVPAFLSLSLLTL